MTRPLAALFALVLLSAGPARAQPPSAADLIARVRQGGYVLLMRHASSPMAVPDKATAEPDNTKPERQLDAEGKTTAAAWGQALRALRVPVGRILSSPTYRALQTVRLAGLPAPETALELGDNAQSMAAVSASQGAWLKQKAAEPPRAGTDTFIITHVPNIRSAYATESMGLADGEALVFRPDGKGGAELLGRVKLEDWSVAAKAGGP